MLLLPCVVAVVDKDFYSVIPFVVASALSLLLGLILKINQESLDSLNLIKTKKSE